MPPAPTIRPARRGEGMTASHAAAHPEHLVATTPQHQSPRPAPAGPRSRTPSHTMKTVAEPDKTHPLTSPTLSGTTWRIPRPGEYRAPGRRAGRPDYHRPPREHGSLGCHETAARHRDRALNLFCARPARSAAPTHAPARPGRRTHRPGLADLATIGILTQHSLYQSELLSSQLRQALSSRVTIEQACWPNAAVSPSTRPSLCCALARNHNLHLSERTR